MLVEPATARPTTAQGFQTAASGAELETTDLEALSTSAGRDHPPRAPALDRGGATMARRKREEREWNATHAGTIADPDVFAREILPVIQALPLSDLVRATGLTHGYLSKVRRGEKEPHPRRCRRESRRQRTQWCRLQSPRARHARLA
jgi:hypothetical protein